MNGKQHAKGYYIAIILFFAYMYFTDMLTVVYSILSITVFFYIDPDDDQKFGMHRWFLTHSILFLVPLIPIFVWNIRFLDIMLFPLFVHLILDIPTKKRTGYYCIRFFKKRLSGNQSFWWLFINVLLIFSWYVYVLVQNWI